MASILLACGAILTRGLKDHKEKRKQKKARREQENPSFADMQAANEERMRRLSSARGTQGPRTRTDATQGPPPSYDVAVGRHQQPIRRGDTAGR
ncbi:hypothetical protein BDY21DRAFT_368124 [Lineolata rhizophorae]|uniref:Uncharacterized protein n=1 Tax=Lineolata rhizophorae TaxID=578093 RepID=A0A6A6PDR3_9PEZI|nr:hypothetical protein BDY21DRAFT_368124 [Lineolata rhizophorae]